jgi:hypothetical protein
MPGPSVRWRSSGHILRPETDVLRFEVADINRVVQRSALMLTFTVTYRSREGTPATGRSS